MKIKDIYNLHNELEQEYLRQKVEEFGEIDREIEGFMNILGVEG